MKDVKTIVYDGDVRLDVRFDGKTVWLSQQQIAELFGVGQAAISKHIKNIYSSGELEEDGTYSILEYMAGNRVYSTKFYNLDMIISVGYRVNSVQATHFRRWAFWLVGGAATALVAPFVWRAIRQLGAYDGGDAVVVRDGTVQDGDVIDFPWWGWVGVVVMAVGWVLAWNRFAAVAPVQRFTYIPLWMGLIVALNGLVYKRSGRCPLAQDTRRYLTLFPVSAAFWWFFEYLNRYVWNWFYVNVGDVSPMTYIVTATISFSTVLPGILVVAELLGTFRFFSDDAFADMMRVNVRSRPVTAVLAVGSAIGLVGIVFVPEFTYPFLWISPFMVVVLLKMLFRSPCALDDIVTGNWSRIVRFAVASLLCGLVWEMWNVNSFTKWIYAVPYVHRFRYFEMPLLGLFGYIPFGIECLVITDAWMKRGEGTRLY